MDAFLSAEMMRMLERIIVVIGGVAAIVLGYRLFALADIRQDSSGKWKSALFEASFTPIGPGLSSLCLVRLCLYPLSILQLNLIHK
jgi:hypothetical protein